LFFANEMTHNCKLTIIWTAALIVLIVAEKHVHKLCTRRCMCMCVSECAEENHELMDTQ
jgi:hypothetical protein